MSQGAGDGVAGAGATGADGGDPGRLGGWGVGRDLGPNYGLVAVSGWGAVGLVGEQVFAGRG